MKVARAGNQRENATGRRLPAVVFYDGHCRFCRRTATWIKRLDWFGNVTVRSFRHDDSWQDYGILPAALESDMHIVAPRRILKGFDAVIALARLLPLLWPAVPLLLLADRCGSGNRAYRFLADNRVIASSPACTTAGAGHSAVTKCSDTR